MILYYLFVLTLPLVDERLLASRLGGPTVEQWLGLLAFAYALPCALRRPAVLARRLRGPALAFVLLYAIAAVSRLARGTATPGNLFAVLSSEGVFLATTLILVDSLGRMRATVLCGVSSVAIASLYVIRDWLAGAAQWGAAYRPGAAAGDANYFTMSVVLLLPVAWHWASGGGRRWERMFCGATAGLALGAVMLAASRGGSLALLAAGVAWWLRARRRWQRGALLLGLVALAAALAPITPLTRWRHPSSGDRASAQDRLELWQAGWAMLARHPWTGVGVGNFKAELPLYAAPGSNLNFVAHNTYLEIAAEMGWPGLAALLALWAAVLAALARTRRLAAGSDSLCYRCAAGFEAGWIGFLVGAFFLSAAFLKLFWLLAFLAAILPALAQREASPLAAEPAPGAPPTPGARRVLPWRVAPQP